MSKLAQAGDIELARSAEIVTKAMAGMGLGIQDTARIADVLAKGANATNTSVNGLAEAFSYVAPVAKSSNLSLVSIHAPVKGATCGRAQRLRVVGFQSTRP